MTKQRRKRALTFQQIKDADDRPLEPCEVPEWGGLIYLKPLGGEQFVEAAEAATKQAGKETPAEQFDFMLKLCGACCVNEEEGKIFTDKEIEVLGEKHFGVVTRIGTRILKMHGMDKEGMEQKKTD